MSVARSLLSVPATSRKMAEKALASGADGVVLDLEDAVAPAGKGAARKDVVSALTDLDWGGKPRMFRINALDTTFFYRDVIEVVEEVGESLDAILVPKVRRAGDLYTLDVMLSAIESSIGLEVGKTKLEAQIESAEGLVNVDEIARVSGRLTTLHFGPGDYAASVGMPQTSIGVADEWDEAYPGHRFQYVMHRIVVTARAAGLRVLDGPVADYRDEEGLRKSCKVARSLGYDGKWCIHPAQIEVVNEVFSPTEEEIEWAKKVVEAYEEANEAGSGAITVDGQMIDAASIRMAQDTLSRGRTAEK